MSPRITTAMRERRIMVMRRAITPRDATCVLRASLETTNSPIVETGDFNGDGMSDILWRDTSGNTAIWFMNGATASGVCRRMITDGWGINLRGSLAPVCAPS
jgi:hypothetical protein